MCKIAFFGFIAFGHTYPTLGLVRELVSRGHQVRYYSFSMLREPIMAAGAEFVPCDDCLAAADAVAPDRIGKDLVYSIRALADVTLAMDEMVTREMECFQPDCVIADSMALWGKAAPLKAGVPFISSTTTFAFNRHVGKLMNQGGSLFSFLLAMPKLNKEIRRLQNKGYPIKGVMDILQNDEQTHTIVYTSREFQPCGETFSDRFLFAGPSLRPASDVIEKTRSKLVYISMGTVNNRMPELYRSCIAAFAQTDLQVILSIGDQLDPAELGPLPENIQVYPRVDQMAVLEKADVFVTHCGMNSVSESIACGVPMVVLPQTQEQELVARRLERFCAGLRPIRPEGEFIRAAVENVLMETHYHINAVILSQSFDRCPGMKGAADLVLQVCGR